MAGGGQGELSGDSVEEGLEEELGGRKAVGRLPQESRWEAMGTPGVWPPYQFGLCLILGFLKMGPSVILKVLPDGCESHL